MTMPHYKRVNGRLVPLCWGCNQPISRNLFLRGEHWHDDCLPLYLQKKEVKLAREAGIPVRRWRELNPVAVAKHAEWLRHWSEHREKAKVEKSLFSSYPHCYASNSAKVAQILEARPGVEPS